MSLSKFLELTWTGVIPSALDVINVHL